MPLVIGPETAKKLKEITENAAKPENLFDPIGGHIPASNEGLSHRLVARDANSNVREYVINFTLCKQMILNKKTLASSMALFRQATIYTKNGSIDKGDILVICAHLGFYGDSEDWIIIPHPQEEGTWAILQPTGPIEVPTHGLGECPVHGKNCPTRKIQSEDGKTYQN